MRLTASCLFGASTMLAVWIAPDKGAALLAAGLLLSGLAAAWLLAWAGHARRRRVPLLGLLGLAATAVAAALSAYAAFTGSLTAPDGHGAVNPNVLAAALAVLLPVGAAAPLWLWTSVRAPHRTGMLVALAGWALLWLAAALALLVTGSRGAWVALLVAALYAAGWASRPYLVRRMTWSGAALDILLLLVAVAGCSLWLWLLAQPGAPAGPAAGRIALWRNGLALIGDAPFTGSGLGSTMMALSTYVYILHVGYIAHVHNLLLELAVEQGLIGLTAYLFLVVTAVAALLRARRREVVPPAMQAALLASLVALLVHGMVDAGLYASRAAALLFLPIGAAWAAGGRTHTRTAEARSRRLLAALAPLAAVALLFAWPGGRAAWQTNLGAVHQTEAELFLYTWPEWPIQDALRRSPVVDLAAAIARYNAALAIDPAQPAANRRLGQLALSRGDLAQARHYLETAYAGDPAHPATRLLLGELYAIAGDAAAAARLWSNLDTSMGQLDGRRWWISETGTPGQLAAFDAALAELQRLRGGNG